MTTSAYPIGTPGVAWGAPERAQWLSRQRKLRSYADDVVARIERLAPRFDVLESGQLDYPPDHYRQYALRSRDARDDLPWVLVTGGVHGYETSGVHGALQFLEQRASDYADADQSPRGALREPVGLRAHPSLERERGRSEPLVPGRQAAGESAAVMRLIAPLQGRFLVHVDLHETTDSDESEFRPALAARDGKPYRTRTDPGRLLRGRRQRESATRVPARDRRGGGQGHAHRTA